MHSHRNVFAIVACLALTIPAAADDAAVQLARVKARASLALTQGQREQEIKTHARIRAAVREDDDAPKQYDAISPRPVKPTAQPRKAGTMFQDGDGWWYRADGTGHGEFCYTCHPEFARGADGEPTLRLIPAYYTLAQVVPARPFPVAAGSPSYLSSSGG